MKYAIQKKRPYDQRMMGRRSVDRGDMGVCGHHKLRSADLGRVRGASAVYNYYD